ncbi:MAG: hypothetical protein KAR11_08975, partial [Phycisphaerae bacterium]|nr:hypothetical protein [Phycisphaerae bacterium]
MSSRKTAFGGVAWVMVLVVMGVWAGGAAGDFVEEFDSDPGWSSEGDLYVWSGPTFETYQGRSMMRTEVPRNGGRVILPFTLEGDFEIEIDCVVFASGDDPAKYSHVKHYPAIFQTGATANVDHQLPFDIFDDDTHYKIDLGAIQLEADLQVSFVKVGDTIETYSRETLLSTYVIEDPAADLYFEFVELDTTSSAAGYTLYDRIAIVPEPTAGVILAAGLMLMRRRKC